MNGGRGGGGVWEVGTEMAVTDKSSTPTLTQFKLKDAAEKEHK